jgi:hypothetical protein
MDKDGTLIPKEERTFLMSKESKLPELSNVLRGN